MGLPPLPAGAEVVQDYTNSSGSANTLPPLPAGAEVVQDYTAAPQTADPQLAQVQSLRATKAKDETEYNGNLLELLHNTNSTKEDVAAYSALNGRKPPTNIDKVLEFRDAHHGAVSDSIVKDQPTGGLRDLAEVQALEGAARAPIAMDEGLAQWVIRAANKAGIVSDVDANMAQARLGYETKEKDAKYIRGTAGAVGNLAGDIGVGALTPLGKAEGATALVALAKTIAKRALVGGLTASVAGGASETPDEQNSKAITGAILTPIMVPALEKVAGAIGNKAVQVYQQVLGRGIGKQLYDAAGNLTTYGNVLRSRLRSINPDLPEHIVDDSLKQLAVVNPKVLPIEKAIVPEMIAQKEGVDLTGAMKSRNAKGIQDFESMQAGSKGTKEGQQDALARSKEIDTSILDNVKDIGKGATSADAGTNTAAKVSKAYNDAKADVDKLYSPLKDSAEKITKPEALKQVRNDILDEFGQGATDTLTSTAKGYLSRLSSLGSQNQKGNATIRFGNVWKLSRDLNQSVRNAQGEDVAQLQVIKNKVDDFIANAPADIFEKGSNGVFAQLKQANSAYRALNKTFGQNNVSVSAGRPALTDTAGKAVKKIIAHVKDVTDRGEDINPGLVDQTIFGSASKLDSAGAKQAANTITRLVKAAPNVADDVKAITLNRVIGQMEQGLYDKTLAVGKTQTTLKGLMDNNKPLLKAAGFTDADVTRLERNAYLASLKAPPAGAAQRGSSATNRGAIKSASAAAFRAALTVALAGAGEHTVGPIGLAAGFSGQALAKAIDHINAMRLSAKTLSSKVPLQPSVAGTRVGQKIGRVVGAQTAKSFANQE